MNTRRDTQNELVRRYGYRLTDGKDGAVFLAEVDRNDPGRVTDSLMMIPAVGDIVFYTDRHDPDIASAYFVACQIRNVR